MTDKTASMLAAVGVAPETAPQNNQSSAPAPAASGPAPAASVPVDKATQLVQAVSGGSNGASQSASQTQGGPWVPLTKAQAVTAGLASTGLAAGEAGFGKIGKFLKGFVDRGQNGAPAPSKTPSQTPTVDPVQAAADKAAQTQSAFENESGALEAKHSNYFSAFDKAVEAQAKHQAINNLNNNFQNTNKVIQTLDPTKAEDVQTALGIRNSDPNFYDYFQPRGGKGTANYSLAETGAPTEAQNAATYKGVQGEMGNIQKAWDTIDTHFPNTQPMGSGDFTVLGVPKSQQSIADYFNGKKAAAATALSNLKASYASTAEALPARVTAAAAWAKKTQAKAAEAADKIGGSADFDEDWAHYMETKNQNTIPTRQRFQDFKDAVISGDPIDIKVTGTDVGADPWLQLKAQVDNDSGVLDQLSGQTPSMMSRVFSPVKTAARTVADTTGKYLGPFKNASQTGAETIGPYLNTFLGRSLMGGAALGSLMENDNIDTEKYPWHAAANDLAAAGQGALAIPGVGETPLGLGLGALAQLPQATLGAVDASTALYKHLVHGAPLSTPDMANHNKSVMDSLNTPNTGLTMNDSEYPTGSL